MSVVAQVQAPMLPPAVEVEVELIVIDVYQGIRGLTGPQGEAGEDGVQGPQGLGYGALNSTSSVAIGTGPGKTFVVDQAAGTNAFTPGMKIRAVSTVNTSAYMDGTLTSYTGNTIVMDSAYNGATGTYTSWKLLLAGERGVQGVTGSAGPAGFTWRGAWSSATAYVVRDTISYNGATYTSILAGTNRQPDTNPTYWSLVAAKGDPGDTKVFIGPTPPTLTAGVPVIWFQTGLGDGTGVDIKLYDGVN